MFQVAPLSCVAASTDRQDDINRQACKVAGERTQVCLLALATHFVPQRANSCRLGARNSSGDYKAVVTRRRRVRCRAAAKAASSMCDCRYVRAPATQHHLMAY